MTTKADLRDLADKANKEHAWCEKAANSMLQHARQCGEALLKAKQALKHGEFTTWIEENCRFSPRMARKYMTLANGWKELAKRNHGSVLDLDGLTMRQALLLLGSGGPEEIGDFLYLKEECPKCGHQLARTSSLWATCVNLNCWDCKLHRHPTLTAAREKDYALDLSNAKRCSKKLPADGRADLLITMFGVHVNEPGIAALAEALKSGPRSDRLAKAKERLRQLVAMLGE